MRRALTFETATPGEHDEFLCLLREEAAEYLDRTMGLMGMSWEEFERIARTVGRILAIRRDGAAVGFYWIEERGRVMHLHGLAVKREFQGQGIGTETLRALITEHRGSVDTIELGVHDSNRVAIALYEKLGFSMVRRLDDLGFSIMQLPLGAKAG